VLIGFQYAHCDDNKINWVPETPTVSHCFLFFFLFHIEWFSFSDYYIFLYFFGFLGQSLKGDWNEEALITLLMQRELYNYLSLLNSIYSISSHCVFNSIHTLFISQLSSIISQHQLIWFDLIDWLKVENERRKLLNKFFDFSKFHIRLLLTKDCKLKLIQRLELKMELIQSLDQARRIN
jgi:hypothetical protein